MAAKKKQKKRKSKPQMTLVDYVQAIINTTKGMAPDGNTLTGEPLEAIEINPSVKIRNEAVTPPDPTKKTQDPSNTPTNSFSKDTSSTTLGNAQTPDAAKSVINFKRRDRGLLGAPSASAGAPQSAYESFSARIIKSLIR
jgi:hypothetical protein